MSKKCFCCEIKQNNMGLSLVELLVAVSVGVIISAAIAGLMSFSVRNYRDQSVNADMQFELQTNINQMMDEIMSASGAVIVHNTGTAEPKLKYAAFGNFNKNYNNGGTIQKGYDVVIFASGQPYDGKFNIYMNRVTGAKTATDTPATIAAAAYSAMGIPTALPSSLAEASPDSLRKYLLGQNATKFNLEFDADCLDTTNGKYENPVAVSVDLQFEKKATNHNVEKHVNDLVYMRNKVSDFKDSDDDENSIGSIFSDGVEYKLKKNGD